MGQDPDKIREDIELTRAEMGETVGAIGYRTDVKSRAKDSMSDKVEGLKAKVGGTGSRVNEATPGTDDIKQGAKRTAGVAQENPLGLALGAVGVGFVAGLLIPSSRLEDERLGPMADEVKDKARETGQEAMERGRDVAQEVAQSASETVQESGQQHAQEMGSSVQDKAQEVRQQAGAST